MNVNYCDLCSNPMKPGQSWILSITQPVELKTEDEMRKCFEQILSSQKEICPTCKHLFDRIFFHRLEGMSALTEECIELFNVPYPRIEDKRNIKNTKKGRKNKNE